MDVACVLGLVICGISRRTARVPIYCGSALLCACLVLAGFVSLFGPIDRMSLPLGLPWIGTHFRLDALSGFFLSLVGLGGFGASVFAVGYGRHELYPRRVLPFYPGFIAALCLVVIADDAFTFLFAWELMSLTSWALVMAYHQEPDNARAGFVYLVMAVFSGMALLLAFGLLAGIQGRTGSMRSGRCIRKGRWQRS